MSWLLQQKHPWSDYTLSSSFPPLSLCVFLRIILSSSFPVCIRFLCASLLSVLLLVCQMMYSRCSSSTAIVGPWRILNNSLSRSLCSLTFSLPNAYTGSSVGSMSGCTVVDVAVFEVCSWDQSVALLNNPLTRPSIFTSLSLLSFFSISLCFFSSAGLQYQSSFRKQPCPCCSPCHNDKLLFTKCRA